MNHLISGIIKIMILEASLALIVVDQLLGTKFEKARYYAFCTVAGLMVWAWSNYGGLRGDISWPYVMLALPIVLICGWVVRVAFRPAGDAPKPKRDDFEGLPGKVRQLGAAL